MPTLYAKYATITDCDIRLAGGILRIVWYSELNDTDLPPANIPKAKDYLISAGQFSERLDDYASILAPGDATISLRDDYSQYGEGVFCKMLSGGITNLLCALSEDGGSTWGFLFAGKVDKKQVNFDEMFISGRFVRGVSIGIITTMSQLDAGVSGVIDDILTRIETGSRTRINATSIYAYPCPVINIFRSCMITAFGSSVVDYANSISLPSGRNDIDYEIGTTNFVNIDNVYFFTSWYENATTTVSKYLDSSNSLAWVKTFATIREMLAYFAKSLGYVFRIFYGDSSGVIDFATMSNNRYRMLLLNRGQQNDGSNFITMVGAEKESKLNLESDLGTKRFQAFPRIEGIGLPNDDSLVQIPCDFWYLGNPPSDLSASLWFIDSNAPYYLFQILAVYCYDYLTKSRYNQIGYSTGTVQKFYEGRYMKATRTYERKYHGLRATQSGVTSQRIICPSSRIQLADGSGINRVFFASETTKDPFLNELNVKWIEE